MVLQKSVFCLILLVVISTRLHTTHGLSGAISNTNRVDQNPSLSTFDDVIQSRYSCTRFQPFDSDLNPNPDVLNKTLHCIDLSRRAPSGFNAQPYRVIVVSSPSAKRSLSKYCLGPNSNRILDSDCTVIFLADLESGRNWKWWKDLSYQRSSNKWKQRKRILFTLLFSSGYPIPRFIRSPLSFCIRFIFSFFSVISRRKLLLPSLSNAETWAVKNTMLFAMTYILSCTSYNLATCPMEGINVGGIKKIFSIPRRFCIPLIVSTGSPLQNRTSDAQDIFGEAHGISSRTRRFPFTNVVFQNKFEHVY